MSEKVTKEPAPQRDELDKTAAEAAQSGAAGLAQGENGHRSGLVSTAIHEPSEDDRRRWEERERQGLRLEALKLAVQLQARGPVRGADVLAEAGKMLAWIEGKPSTPDVA